ncbi:MAG: hypothetical protein AAGA48_05480 [Myxococcota bacterium]
MLIALFVILGALAQPVAPGRWRTLQTPHFRIHYPRAAKAYATDVGERIEAMRERVAAEVGVVPDHPVDVLIVDPFAASNGQALPDSRGPRMRLFTSPPPADSVIGHQRDWVENLVVHEDTHIVHLTLESRNGLRRFLQRTTGWGPVPTKIPRWVVEGYATVVEGRLTGAGRPNDDASLVWLRLLARTGRFPVYGELSGANRHRGGGFAYLVGAAFLDWIEAQHHQGALRDLWARLTARQDRSFKSAFAGLFGESPQVAYGRFVAEVMAEAWPTPWPDRSNRVFERPAGLGHLSVSPDGERIAVPVFSRNGRSSLVVFSAMPPEDFESERQAAIERQLRADPEDVAAIPPPYVPHAIDRVRVHRRRVARNPRFVDDSTILFESRVPDRKGRFRSDLYLWNVDEETERRVTRRADVRSADPAPSGTWAVAVRQRWGETQIVEVDLATGDLTPVSEPGLTPQVDHPRVTPNGQGLVWLENRGRGYGWMYWDRQKGQPRWHPVSLDGPQLRHLAFTPEGHVVAEVAWRGELAVYDLGPADAPAGPVDLGDAIPRTLVGGAEAPEVGPDGTWWVTTMTPDGGAIHRLDEPVDRPLPGSGDILKRAGPDQPPPLVERRVPMRRSYRLGHWTWIPLGGFGVSTTGQGQGELALTGGDVMGRYSAQGFVALAPAERGVRGASVGLGARGANQRWKLTGFLGEDRRFGVRRAGGALTRKGGHRLGIAANLRTSLGAVVERVDLGDGGLTRVAGQLGASLAVVEPRRDIVALEGFVTGQVGQTGGLDWQLVRGGGRFQLGRYGLTLRYETGLSTGETVLDQWTHGGTPVSVWPAVANGGWLTDPAFEAVRQQGTHYDRLDLALGLWQVQAFATRTRVGRSLPSGGLTVVGIRGGTQVASDPFVSLFADGRGTVGVGRIVEDPAAGWSWQDGQWVAFATWTWQ